MKKYLLPSIMMLAGLGLITYAIITNKPPVKEKQPVYVEYFTQGQILYPDYACPDTLIVRDAAGLNKAMAYVEQDISWGSDADCDSLIHCYAVPINENQP